MILRLLMLPKTISNHGYEKKILICSPAELLTEDTKSLPFDERGIIRETERGYEHLIFGYLRRFCYVTVYTIER